MKDDRRLLRWLDLSWFAPMPLSLGLAIWAIMMRPDPATLAVLLVVQMALMASACSVPAGLAAQRSRIWWRRLAPSGFSQTVHRAWREQALALLVLGLVGPAAAAARAYDMGASALVFWALALPLLGAALGTLAAWAWSGSLRPAGLALWPALAGLALLMALTPQTWLDTIGLAVATLGASLLMLVWAWRTSQRLQPTWPGMRQALSRWHRPPAATRRWRWDTLAFDDQARDAAGRPAPWWTQHLPFLLVGLSGSAPLKVLLADELAGIAALDAVIYLGLLTTFAMTGLLVRVAHWRLRLAPGGPSQRLQVAWMMSASTLSLVAVLGSIAAIHAWRHDMAASDLVMPLTRACCDAALAVALATWLRGLNNRSLPMLLAVAVIVTGAAATLWLLHTQSVALPRGGTTMAVEVAATVALTALAWPTWRRRALRGARQDPARVAT